MGKINWDMFEERVVLCFTEKQDRMKHVEKELARVGMKHIVHWNFPTPYDRWEMARLPIDPFIKARIGCYNVSKGHYAVIKTAYHLGCKSILIMEDDCRFAKDIENGIVKPLESAPSNWDVLMLDHFKLRGDTEKVNDYWTACRASASCACYALSHLAMHRIIKMYESAVSGKYRMPLLRNCDMWTDKKYLGNDINFYCATPNIAVQTQCPDESNCGRRHCDGKYASIGIPYSNYEVY